MRLYQEAQIMSPTTRSRVLFVCTNNSARSQMAEGLLRHLHGDRYEVQSAGTEPAEVNPLAVRAMNERGVDISGQRSKSLNELRGREFDLVVTVSRPGERGLPLLSRRWEEGPPELPRSRSRR